MPILVSIPPPLRRLSGGAPLVPVEGATVAAALGALAAAHPALGRGLLDDAGRLRRFARLAVNGVLEGDPERPLAEGDRLELVLAVAGG